MAIPVVDARAELGRAIGGLERRRQTVLEILAEGPRSKSKVIGRMTGSYEKNSAAFDSLVEDGAIIGTPVRPKVGAPHLEWRVR